MSKRMMLGLLALIVVVGGGIAWMALSQPKLPAGFAAGNGRLEANEIYVATKYPGRIREIMFNEGDTVEAGQIVAKMDTSALEAELREAEARITESKDNLNVALAQIAVRQANYNFARQQNDRSKELVKRGAVSAREAEIDSASMLATKAELTGAQAQSVQARSAIQAAEAQADRLRAEIADAVLVAPIRSRIDTRLAEPGEVLSAGGRVFSLVDLSDVYMYVFLPERTTGKITIGSEARIVLDAAPEYPVQATVSFVSPTAQFTPKTVETAEERHNLTFRVKLQIPKERLRRYEPLVKAGIPGMGYVRVDPKAPWPENLESKGEPPEDLWEPSGRVASN